jgi:hypothetical protein
VKKCKQCGVKSDIGQVYPIGYICSDDCRDILIKRQWQKDHDKRCQKAYKEKKKVHAKQKLAFYQSDIKTRKLAAKNACHAYIKARDIGRSCICCERPLGKNYDSGHFIPDGSSSFLRYHEDNIHSQSVYCNRYKSGNPAEYEKRLRIKIGDERVEYLLANKNRTVKRTSEDYKEIELYYKDKLKELI